MSRPKFASITADLLARKGDAVPWQPSVVVAQPAEPARQIEPLRQTEPVPPVRRAPRLAMLQADRPPPSGPELRRCVVRLSARDYEKLGIAAVKKDTTRQKILLQAVEDYLSGLQRELQDACGCLSACEDWTGCCETRDPAPVR